MKKQGADSLNFSEKDRYKKDNISENTKDKLTNSNEKSNKYDLDNIYNHIDFAKCKDCTSCRNCKGNKDCENCQRHDICQCIETCSNCGGCGDENGCVGCSSLNSCEIYSNYEALKLVDIKRKIKELNTRENVFTSTSDSPNTNVSNEELSSLIIETQKEDGQDDTIILGNHNKPTEKAELFFEQFNEPTTLPPIQPPTHNIKKNQNITSVEDFKNGFLPYGVILTFAFFITLLTSLHAEKKEIATYLETYPSNVEDFSTKNKVLSKLDDGRNIVMYELPFSYNYNAINLPEIYISDVQDKKVFFTVDEPDNIVPRVIQMYDLAAGELTEFLDTHIYDKSINEKYILCSLDYEFYLYDKEKKIGEYIPHSTLSKKAFNYTPKYSLIGETLFYGVDNILYAYDIPKKTTKAVFEFDEEYTVDLQTSTGDYLFIELLKDNYKHKKAIIYDTKTDTEILNSENEYDTSTSLMFETKDSIILSDVDIITETITLKIDKKSKEIVELDEAIGLDFTRTLTPNILYDDLVFEVPMTNFAGKNPITLNVHSLQTSTTKTIDLREHLGEGDVQFEIKEDGVLLEVISFSGRFIRNFYITTE